MIQNYGLMVAAVVILAGCSAQGGTMAPVEDRTGAPNNSANYGNTVVAQPASKTEVKRPEQAFVSDVTYVESHRGTHYLSLVTDAYSRKIMGYEVSDDLKAEHMVNALKHAIKNRITKTCAIHHSDRGLQYCSKQYQDVLQHHQIQPSMTDGYDCYQNALAERINGILKQEFLITKCNDMEQLKEVVKQSIDIYNRYRPHLSLGMQTPEQVHQKRPTAKHHWP